MRFVIAITAALAACSGAQTGGGAGSGSADNADNASGPTELTVRATLETALQCGGALFDNNRPSSSAGAYRGLLLVRRGNENSKDDPLATMTNDGEGELTATLPPGEYCLVREEKRARMTGVDPANYTSSCLREHFKKCDLVVTHPSAEPVVLALTKPCLHPCYIGPPPP